MKREFWSTFILLELVLLLIFIISIFLNNFIPKFFPNDFILFVVWIFLSILTFFFVRYR